MKEFLMLKVSTINIELPNHVPTSIRDEANLALKNHIYEEGTPFFHAFEHYIALKNLLLDDVIMPNVWKELERIHASEGFFRRISNDICLWGMVDKTPFSEQAKIYNRIQNHIDKLIDLINKSGEVRYASQIFFEQAVHKLSKKEHYPTIDFKQINATNGMMFFDLSDLLSQYSEILENYEPSFCTPSNRSNSRIFPKKLNEGSSYRTYLVRCVSEIVENIFEQKRYSLVADIIQAMLPDSEPLTDDHIYKLL